MKVFYLARLFSGLESSFMNEQWSPTGVPTIYRVIEKIDKKYNTCFVFTAKDSGSGYFSSWNNHKDEVVSVDGLNHDVAIISGINFFPIWMGRKFRIILREIRQTGLILYKIYKFKPDILYCDNANIIIAALFSRMQKHTSVVFRVMGVNNFMHTSVTNPKIYQRIYRWAYSSPFSLAICTQDGSGVEKWVNQALSVNTRKEILLNGVDTLVLPDNVDLNLTQIKKNKIIILFVGKLEKYKGCYEFVEAVLSLVTKKVLNIHALIIGSGTEEKRIKELVDNVNANIFFTFIKHIPHSQILYAHSICDIYVSMNHLGNLSNANLEAIQSNDCMVIPLPQKHKGIDEVTALLLKDSVVGVPIDRPDKLSNTLLTLVNSKSKREKMSKNIRKRKKTFLWSWDDRINTEIGILERLKGTPIEK